MQRKLFTTALRQYLSDIPLIEHRVSVQAEKLVQFMEDQDGKPFDPADSLMRAVANVICGITFGEGEDTTTNPDLDRLLKLNAESVANVDDNQLLAILEFFPCAQYLPIKAYDRVLIPFFEVHDIIRKVFKQRENRSSSCQERSRNRNQWGKGPPPLRRLFRHLHRRHVSCRV